MTEDATKHGKPAAGDVPSWFSLDVGPDDRLPGAPAFVTLEWIRRWAAATPTGLRKLHEGITKRRRATGKFAWWPTSKRPEADDLPYLLAMAMQSPQDFPTVLRDYSLGVGRGTVRRSTFFDKLHTAYYEKQGQDDQDLYCDVVFVNFLEDPTSSVGKLGKLMDKLRKTDLERNFARREPYTSLFRWIQANFPDAEVELDLPEVDAAGAVAQETPAAPVAAAKPVAPKPAAAAPAPAPVPVPAKATVPAKAANASPAPAAPVAAAKPVVAEPAAEQAVAARPAAAQPAPAPSEAEPPQAATQAVETIPAAAAASQADDDEAMRAATARCRAALSEAVTAIEAALANDVIPRLSIRPAALAVLEATRQARLRESLASAPADVAGLLAEVAASLSRLEGLGQEELGKATVGLLIESRRTLVPRGELGALRESVDGILQAAESLAKVVEDGREQAQRLARAGDFKAVMATASEVSERISELGAGFAATVGEIKARIDGLVVPERVAPVRKPVPAQAPAGPSPSEAAPVAHDAAPPAEPDAIGALQEAMRDAAGRHGGQRKGVSLADLQATTRGSVARQRQMSTDHVSSAVLSLFPNGQEGFERTVACCVRWMTGKHALGIPDEALTGKDFRTESASAIYARGLSIENQGTRFWAGIFQEPDSREPGRKWAVEMCVGELAGSLKFGVRLMTSSTTNRWTHRRTMPRVVRDVMRALNAFDGPHRMPPTPQRLAGPEGLEAFDALVFSKSRSLPVVALAVNASNEPTVAAEHLASALAGAAHVVIVEDSVSRLITARHGKPWSIYLGAVRIYQPGVDAVTGDPDEHRYYKADAIARMNAARQNVGPGMFELQITDQILRETEKRFAGSSIPTFEQVEAIAAQIARQAAETEAKATGSVDDGLLASYQEELAAQRRLADEANSLLEHASEELKSAESERDDAWSRNLALNAEVSRLREALSARAPEAGRPAAVVPANLDELCAFAETGLGLNVFVLPKAVRETRKTRNVDVGRLHDALVFLRDHYVPYRKGEVPKHEYQTAMRKARFNEDACFATRGSINAFQGYTALWKGERIELDRHLKWGVGGTDTMIRVYFCYDEESQVCIVGHMPTHLDNHLTN